jgi:hypothetical protein
VATLQDPWGSRWRHSQVADVWLLRATGVPHHTRLQRCTPARSASCSCSSASGKEPSCSSAHAMLKPTSELSDALICIAAATSVTCEAASRRLPAPPLEHALALPVRGILRQPRKAPPHLVRMPATDVGCKDVGAQLQRLHLHAEHCNRVKLDHGRVQDTATI